MRKIILTAVALGALLTLTACGGGGEATTTATSTASATASAKDDTIAALVPRQFPRPGSWLSDPTPVTPPPSSWMKTVRHPSATT